MEIKQINSTAINSYKAIKKISPEKKSGGVENNVEVADSGKFDKVEFDFAKALESAKANIAGKLNADAGADRIGTLKAAYAGGTCPVSVDAATFAIAGE